MELESTEKIALNSFDNKKIPNRFVGSGFLYTFANRNTYRRNKYAGNQFTKRTDHA